MSPNLNPKWTQTETFSTDSIMAKGEGTVFKGAPDVGVIAGPEYSPQLPGTLSHSGERNDGPSGAGPIRGGSAGSDISGETPGLDSGAGTPPQE
jgi:hypothetical protein